MTVVAAAMVSVGMAGLRAVEHPHRPATAPATDQPGQQRTTTARRFTLSAALHVGVLRDQLLVRLILFPADIAGVVIADQDVPGGHRLRMARGFAGAPVDDARALDRAAEDISAGID